DNTATLSSEGKDDVSASNNASLTYGKLIEKLPPSFVNDENVKGHVYDWTVKYNYGYKKLPANSSITDTVSKNLAYIDDSVKVTTKDGKVLSRGTDYTVTIKDNQMKIEFLKELDTAVDVTYRTKVVGDVAGDTEDVNFTNNVKTDSGFESNNGGQIATDGLVKWGDVDYKNRKINWSIQVNKYQYHMTNWKLSDTMSPGLTFNPDTFRIYNEQSREDLVKDTHYTLKETTNGFDVAFIGDLATEGTDSTYRIMYTTDFEPLKGNFSNTATADWKDSAGKDRHESVTRDEPIKLPFVKDVIKSGSYNAQTKKISWDVTVNHNQETLIDASIVDPIMDDQDYVPGSARLFEMEVNRDGSLTPVKEVSELIKVSEDGKTISAKLPDNSKSPYKLVFETSLEGKLIDQTKYHNVASYTNKGVETKADADAEVTKGNVYGEKTGEVDKSNENFVKWSVNVNPSQSTVKDMTVVDKPSSNQVLEESSVIVYGANVGSDGSISANRDVVLEKGKDYTVNIETNNETGQQVLTVKFVNEISKAYVLEYRSMANTSLLQDYLTNNISVTGNNEKIVKTETSSSVKVVNSSGTATGTTASVKIVKIDKNSKEKTPLPGAKFELWTIKGNGQKDQLVRSGETDVKGELKFGNLRPNTDYLLFETKAPTGFTVSEEMRYGQKVKFSSDGETNLFKSHTVENDMPRIHFNKIDGNDGHALTGAQFMVKNEQGEFYNGIDSKYRATWVDSQDKVSDDVKKSLTSDATGQVEVEGLSVGTYSIQEIVAPEGYDKATKDIPFEVIDDEGLIRLKDDVTISNMPYEKTEITINKTWDDANNQDGKRPKTISFDLFANGKKVDTLEMTDDKQAPGNVWEATFSGLRKYDDNMKEITYSIKENEVDKYSVSDKEVIVKDKKAQVTNSYKPEEVSVLAKKHWDDKDNQDGKRPGYIVVHVMAKVEGEEKPTSVNHIR
ncbi:MAG: collagen binding domain-containing protein, partial [Vagococcus sp.]